MRCRFQVIESLSLTKYRFFKLGKSRPLFSFLFVFSMQLTVNSWYKVCRRLDSNHRPLVSEPTEPLHKQSIFLVFHLNDDDVCSVLHSSFCRWTFASLGTVWQQWWRMSLNHTLESTAFQSPRKRLYRRTDGFAPRMLFKFFIIS